jgi:carboxyl-terminal processing protease
VSPEKAKDTQLNYAIELLHGIKSVDSEPKKKAEAN